MVKQQNYELLKINSVALIVLVWRQFIANESGAEKNALEISGGKWSNGRNRTFIITEENWPLFGRIHLLNYRQKFSNFSR